MVEPDDVTRTKSETVLHVDMPQESHTESDTAIPTTVPSEPPVTSTESPTTDSGNVIEKDMSSDTPSETTDTAVEQSSTEPAKTYPKRSRIPVERFEPTW